MTDLEVRIYGQSPAWMGLFTGRVTLVISLGGNCTSVQNIVEGLWDSSGDKSTTAKVCLASLPGTYLVEGEI